MRRPVATPQLICGLNGSQSHIRCVATKELFIMIGSNWPTLEVVRHTLCPDILQV